jgi:hypothetical protein
MNVTVNVRPDGRVEAIYDDALLPVFAALGGDLKVERASHVEPAGTLDPVYDPRRSDDPCAGCGHPHYRHFDGWDDMRPVGCKYCRCRRWLPYAGFVPAGWAADMRPSGGPILLADADGHGFETRQAALDAEVAWLREHRGL